MLLTYLNLSSLHEDGKISKMVTGTNGFVDTRLHDSASSSGPCAVKFRADKR